MNLQALHDIDMMTDPILGPVLLEINPRPSGSLAGLSSAGYRLLDYALASAVGISIDIDAVDPADAPGVSTPEPNGIAANELISALPAVCQHPKWLASELTEFLPSQDLDNKTEKLALALLGTLLGVKTSCTTE